MKISPSKVKGAPISKSNLLPFSENSQAGYPKKFVSPANKDDSIVSQSLNRNATRGTLAYGYSFVGNLGGVGMPAGAAGGWTSSSSGTRKL
jgi:hypothetical protein